MIYYLTDVIEERFYPKAPEAGADLPRAGSSVEIYYLLISLTLPIPFLNDLDLSFSRYLRSFRLNFVHLRLI